MDGIALMLPALLKEDAGCLLACGRVTEAFGSKGIKVKVRFCTTGTAPPACDAIRVRQVQQNPGRVPRATKAESYRIFPCAAGGRRELGVEGDERGIMYGLFKLAERVRIDDDPWRIDTSATPAFSLRIFSDEGQLLNIPDHGYYSDSPPFVNERIMRQETDEAKEAMRQVVGLGYNAFALLNPTIEEYVDYEYLDKKVYPANARHRARSKVFCKYLRELCDYGHSLHLEVYLQVYEMQFPDRLDRLYGVDLDSRNMERILHARYRELFERIPLDGMIITATEVHPRAGYKSKQFWKGKGRAGAGRMANLFHNACKAAGKRCIYRLWWIADDDAGTREVAKGLSDDLVLSIKNTGGDFWLNFPTTTAITKGAAREQPLAVEFDTFRQYDGWTRLFIYMKRWGDVVRACRDNGVLGLNAWGDWSAGCVWPNYQPGYLRDGRGRFQRRGAVVSWRGHWSRFRMLTRGFTPGRANVYLLGALGWNPDLDVKQIARDFAALHLGAANALAAAEALLATEDAFSEEYIGVRRDVAHPCYIKWAMVFHPRPEELERAYSGTFPQQVLQSNERALICTARMEAAFDRVNPAEAPNATSYARFREGIEKTALYLRTFYLWRECWWRNRWGNDLRGKARDDNAAALVEAKGKLMALFEQWAKYPEEAGFWRITFRYGRPRISPDGIFPYFLPHGQTTMETTAQGFGS